jgi:hypothetical protein
MDVLGPRRQANRGSADEFISVWLVILPGKELIDRPAVSRGFRRWGALSVFMPSLACCVWRLPR